MRSVAATILSKIQACGAENIALALNVSLQKKEKINSNKN